MDITYHRAGGRPPVDDERLRVDGRGTYTLWRTVAAEAVGSFGGALPTDLADLQRLADRAVAGGELQLQAPPDAAIEHINVGSVSARLPASADPPPPWSELVAALRQLLREGQRQPRAALVLVSDGPGHVRLRHAGSEPLRLDLSELAIRGTVWQGSTSVERLQWNFDGGHVEAGPGWRRDLELAPSVPLSEERFVVFFADFRIEREGYPLPVRVTRNCHVDAPVMPIG